MLRAHAWDIPKSKQIKNLFPLLNFCFKTVFQKYYPNEGIIDAYKLKLSQGFRYPILLGIMVYAYVTCHPNISYATTTMSKFSTKPSQSHYKLLKGTT